MNKLTNILLLTFMCLSIAACQNKGGTTYKDGTYEALGDKWQYGQESATVQIKSNKITDINLKRLDTNGKEVNYEEWTGVGTGANVRPNLKQFRLDMAKRILDKQSYDVDSIASATVSTNNWKIATQRALEKAKK